MELGDINDSKQLEALIRLGRAQNKIKNAYLYYENNLGDKITPFNELFNSGQNILGQADKFPVL